VRGLTVAVAALAAALWVVVVACQTSTDCTCTIDQNGDHRVVACGNTVCVGGSPFTCSDGKAVAQSGACATPAPGDTSSGAPAPEGGMPIDHSCDDLSTYCNTSCRKPASVSADCLATAGSGDPARCAAWQSSNSVLCSP
jgi:hypothetical protein